MDRRGVPLNPGDQNVSSETSPGESIQDDPEYDKFGVVDFVRDHRKNPLKRVAQKINKVVKGIFNRGRSNQPSLEPNANEVGQNETQGHTVRDESMYMDLHPVQGSSAGEPDEQLFHPLQGLSAGEPGEQPYDRCGSANEPSIGGGSANEPSIGGGSANDPSIGDGSTRDSRARLLFGEDLFDESQSDPVQFVRPLREAGLASDPPDIEGPMYVTTDNFERVLYDTVSQNGSFGSDNISIAGEIQEISNATTRQKQTYFEDKILELATRKETECQDSINRIHACKRQILDMFTDADDRQKIDDIQPLIDMMDDNVKEDLKRIFLETASGTFRYSPSIDLSRGSPVRHRSDQERLNGQ